MKKEVILLGLFVGIILMSFVSSDFQVECTSTADCLESHGEGYVCDLSVGNFGKCIKSTTPTYCGDGYCDIGETKSNCPEDCDPNYQPEQEKSINNLTGYIIVGASIIIGFIILAIILKRKKKRK